MLELYKLIGGFCGYTPQPASAPERLGELRRSALDAGKAQRLLGWKPETSLEEGLKLTVDSMRAAFID